MTHPTDEELAALVKRLRKMDERMSFQSVDIEGARACRLAADTITTLRAQLAEVQAELVRRVDMHECAMAERDDATLYSDEQRARADRAEAELGKEREDRANEQKSFLKNFAELADETLAALAAQVEVDAGIADRISNTHGKYAETNSEPQRSRDISMQIAAHKVADAIRNQPHDRTTLDRMLADAEAKALRKAADEMEDERAKQAILAMIPKEGE